MKSSINKNHVFASSPRRHNLHSISEEEHKRHLRIVLDKIKDSDIALKTKKCHLFKKEQKILGYKANEDEIRLTEDRIQGFHDFSVSTNIKELRSGPNVILSRLHRKHGSTVERSSKRIIKTKH